jgi:predicted DNA-binding transcriptional regulator AlpA
MNRAERPRGKWLTPEEMAKKAGLSVSWVYKAIRKGTCPWDVFPVTATKKIADSADIDEWLEKNKMPAGEAVIQ